MPLSSQNKVYLPSNARDNQYLLVEIKASEALYQAYDSLQQCYEQISQQFFHLAEQAGLRNVHFIANDKMPVVRYHSEAYCLPTQEQILFFYNPKYHEAQNSFFSPNYAARKIALLFLATGEDIRNHAADFHSQVKKVVDSLLQALPVAKLDVKVRDHQHLSYDLFAKAKNPVESYGFKLRGLAERYGKRQLTLPAEHNAMTYVTLSLPLTRKVKMHLLPQIAADQGYAPLYQTIEAAFLEVMAKQQLTRLAFIANGKIPLVRNSRIDKPRASDELQMLGFDVTSPHLQNVSFWQADHIVETLHFVVVAGQDDQVEQGYGRFMNRLNEGVQALSLRLGLDANCDDVIIRFHQHLSYYL